MENYIINRNGTIFSKKTNKYLKPCDNGTGYLLVNLSINGKRKNYTVHRLVAENTFQIQIIFHK